MINNSTFYSQNFEDVILARCFPQITDGFYIDVGAHLEEVDSITKFFYERGWSGINVEPVIEFASTFQCRDRDTTICCAAGSEENILPMSISLGTGLSTFSDLNSASIQSQGHVIEKRDIQVRRLDSILESLGITKKSFEFLKIDAEGSELDVIKGIDLFRYRPQIILCEVTTPNTTAKVQDFDCICQSIESCNYQKIYFDGINQWWCESQAIDDLAKHFTLPPCIFDSDLISPNSGTSARKQLAELAQKLNDASQELTAIRLELEMIRMSKGFRLVQFVRKVMSTFKV